MGTLLESVTTAGRSSDAQAWGLATIASHLSWAHAAEARCCHRPILRRIGRRLEKTASHLQLDTCTESPKTLVCHICHKGVTVTTRWLYAAHYPSRVAP